MDVSAIISEYGAYYLNSKQGRASLSKVLNYQAKTESVFTRIMTNDTKIDRASSVMTRLLQPFQKTWSPTGAVGFTPLSIPLFKMKGDFEEYPDELEETWLGFLASNDLDRKNWPFVKWLLEVHIVPQMAEDLEMNEIYAGSYLAPPTPGTAGVAGTAMDGIKTVLNYHIGTSGRISTIATGAPNADAETWVGQVEAFVRAIDKRYWMTPMDICMSQELELRFKDGMEVKYNTQYKQENDIAKVKNFPHRVVGLPSHVGANKIWCTPKGNAILGVKRPALAKAFKIESVDRLVKVFTDGFKGVGFVLPEIVFTNDQDLV